METAFLSRLRVSLAMTADAMHETAQDTPSAYQHAWKKAARDDPRMKARHLAVVDAYAEHYYAGREAMRGVGVTDSRLTYWTGHGATSVREARADLIRWGWLGLVKAHGRGHVARYALITPELGISAGVIPKESARRTVKTVERPSEESARRTAKAVKRPQGGHIPLPTPHRLPTPVTPQPIGQPSTRQEPPRGRQGISTTSKTPKTAVAARSDLERAVPAEVLDTTRGRRSGPVLGAALALAMAAGWTPEQVRAELAGAERGAREPVAVCVRRMQDLAKVTPPAAPLPTISAEDRSAAISAGRECQHGEADLINPSTGLHICPICRRAAATA